MTTSKSPSSALAIEAGQATRAPLAGLAFFMTALVSMVACDIGVNVDYRLDNRTESTICYGRFNEDVAAGSCLSELDPLSATRWTTQCNSSMRDVGLKTPITVILAIESTGEHIYQRTALCSEWRDSGGSLVIEQASDRFIVTDSLSGASSP